VEPLYEVGGVSARAWAAFGAVAQVVFDDAGRLYVLDTSAKNVTVVSVDGSFVGTVGGPGDGPGELASPSGLSRDRDGVLIVFDQARRSFVTYDSLGAYIDAVPLHADIAAPVGPLGIDPSGRVFSSRDDRVRSDDAEATVTREFVLHAVAPGANTEVVYRGWSPPTPEVRELTPEETGGMRVRLSPLVGFHPTLHGAALSDGRLAIVDSTDYRVRFVGGGRPTPDLTRPLAPQPVDGSLREAERDRRARLLRDAPQRLMRSSAEGARSEVATDAITRLELARIEGMGFHDVVPVIQRLGVDPAGNLWVGRAGKTPDRPGPIDVARPEGQYLGTLQADGMRLPDAFGPNGLVAHILIDDNGATRIEVGRLVTPGGTEPSAR
jgi:hypothetical protein